MPAPSLVREPAPEMPPEIVTPPVPETVAFRGSLSTTLAAMVWAAVAVLVRDAVPEATSKVSVLPGVGLMV